MEKRRFKRFDDKRPVKIRGELFYSENICRGGLYVADESGAAAAQPDSELDCEIILPPIGRTVRVKSKVVFAIDANAGAQLNRSPGFALEFKSFESEEDGRCMSSYVERVAMLYNFARSER